ncbi:DUF5340 domain-containing protein [Thalassoporum mexicanum]|uniref:DUF5340 domain-containing protein n=1 Tax=Thalassoporum mexicanum TaxID=3457544 RepID=UPI0018DCB06A|nr:DUF5340 domain-containing protein [Pseudanabaena sp. PCC 7367]
MEPIPIPSHIHYELLLQLLERQTLPAIDLSDRVARENIQNTIIMLRKALVLQKQFEENCEHRGIATTYRWSLNEANARNGGKANGNSISGSDPVGNSVAVNQQNDATNNDA